MTHKHKAAAEVLIAFSHSVGGDARADGGVSHVETCDCGARRYVNSNGRWIARGDWEAPGTLRRYSDGSFIRPATEEERNASIRAARRDGGAGVILVDGARCYVED